MLGKYNVGPVLAVKDLGVAAGFYGGVLGLHPEKQDEQRIVYSSGSSTLEVYVSSFAGTNQATAATWEADDIEAEVAELNGKGVKFEHYTDMPGVKLEGDIHLMGDEKAVWFKDPDGNILCIHS